MRESRDMDREQKNQERKSEGEGYYVERGRQRKGMHWRASPIAQRGGVKSKKTESRWNRRLRIHLEKTESTATTMGRLTRNFK